MRDPYDNLVAILGLLWGLVFGAWLALIWS
jgi:hypothetical protein